MTIEQRSRNVTLRAGWAALALQLQEAAGDLASSDVRSRLSDALQDAHAGTGQYANYLDHFGDDSDGDVCYNCGGETYMAPYEITGGGDGGAAKANIDLDSKKQVIPRTTYEDAPVDDNDDGMANMYEAWKRDKIYAQVPLVERFVSKAERDTMSSDDFAGKGKSFPINKAADVMAAVHSMGRAGSGNYGPAALKANIIRIAKKKGFTSSLPKAWQGTDAKEAARTATADTLRLVESTPFVADILSLREAFATAGGTKAIKLISPGRGASAYYTAEALKRAAVDKIFKAGTPMRIDHPTRAQEADRPEGSVKDWGAVLASDAEYQEAGSQGPGLYASIKPFSDHAQTIEEKGPYAGVSIAAHGEALTEAGRPVLREGLPVLAKFTAAEGVDMVTRAGAGGMFLSEAARVATDEQEDSGMTAEEQRQFKEALATTSRLQERALRSDAITAGAQMLQGISLPDPMKQLVVDNVLREALPIKDGIIDSAKFREAIETEAKRVGQAFGAATGSGNVYGMGQQTEVIDPKILEARKAQEAEMDKVYTESWASLMPGVPKAGVLLAMKGRAA